MDILLTTSKRPPIAAANGDLSKAIKDTYDVFIDSGGPDTYLMPDLNGFFNDTFNGTLIDTNDTYRLNTTIDPTNTTSNQTEQINDDVAELVIMAATSIVLGLMILVTIIGNVFVIAAIILERNLQNVANYLVASLAVADLLVACLVMPLGAVYEISKGWILGPELCDIWTSCDVLCCTASILHLVAIAADRYWAVTNVDYIHARTTRRVLFMIFLVWGSAFVVSLAPQFGWKDAEYLQRIEQQKCMVSQDVGYQIFATCTTFYVPLLVILVLYWKIYQTARKRIHRRRPKQALTSNNNQGPTSSSSEIILTVSQQVTTTNQKSSVFISEAISQVTEIHDQPRDNQKLTSGNLVATTRFSCASVAQTQTQSQAGSQPSSPVQKSTGPKLTINTPVHDSSSNRSPSETIKAEQKQRHVSIRSQSNQQRKSKTRKETLEAKRERKAAKTLAIITGAFVICWLPFFLMALILPLCGKACTMNDKVAALFLWLGYFNSTLNPVIYTIFSPVFRQAFKRILFGTHRANIYRRGKI